MGRWLTRYAKLNGPMVGPRDMVQVLKKEQQYPLVVQSQIDELQYFDSDSFRPFQVSK
jgi:hypothetical protein